MKHLYLLATLFFVLFSCKSKKSLHELSIQEYSLPPGSVKISDNLFLDESDVSNFSYLEYLWWTGRVYGSQKYKEAFPDTSVWHRLGKHYSDMDTYYLRHPKSREYPVVGVTYKQALDFCEWRANRVMEFILIRERIIKHDPTPHKDSVFTIEKYFSGKYKVKPNPYLKYYPSYSLPDSLTYLKAIQFADSLNEKNYKGKKDRCGKDPQAIRCYQSIVNKTDSFPYGIEPLLMGHCYKNRKPQMTYKKGNVREITSNPNFSFGGSFKDSCNAPLFLPTETPNSFTGFRNVCRWKKWGE